MKGERKPPAPPQAAKLRLVAGGEGKPLADEEPPFTAADLAEAAALREALEAGSDPLAEALGAAYAPPPLAPADLDAIVGRVLGDEGAATAAERAAAERLRADLDHLEDVEGGQGSAASQLARALRSAARPAPLDPARNEVLIAAMLRAPLRRKSPVVRRIAPVTMGALAAVAAMAAGVALVVGRPPPSGASRAAAAALVPARSADDLFDAATPFPRRGGESARVDRIASARAADLRRNRFAAWGVK